MNYLDNSGEINIEKINKFFDEHIQDKEWLKLMEENFKICKEEVDNDLPALQTKWERVNVTKDQCDFRILSVVDCVNTKSFLVKFI